MASVLQCMHVGLFFFNIRKAYKPTFLSLFYSSKQSMRSRYLVKIFSYLHLQAGDLHSVVAFRPSWFKFHFISFPL